MTRAPRLVRLTALTLGLVLVLSGWAGRPVGAASAVNGAGSTFAAIAIEAWRSDVARQGLAVNYAALGSSQGRTQFKARTVDFASSDIGFEPEEQPVGRDFTYLPLVAGGTGLMYNLKDTAGRQISTLRLSGPTIARIFTGEIRRWRAPEVLADNPELQDRMPDEDIKAVVRSGGSGTTAVFTGYFSAVAPDVWGRFKTQWGIPGDFTSSYPDVPGLIKQSGSDGIANFVANPNAGRGSIGYAEAGYAIQRGLPMAYVNNAAGLWTQPTARNVAVALLEARENPDGTQNLSGVYFNRREETYAISSYNYLVAPTSNLDEGKGETIIRFILYSVTQGQAKAAPLGYSPLPPNLVDAALRAAARVPAPQSVRDAALAEVGRWGQFYLELEPSTPLPPPPDPQSGAGDGGPVAFGPGVVAGPGAEAGLVAQGAGEAAADAAAAEAATAEEELAAGLATRLEVDETGRVVLGDSAAAGALDASDNRTRVLMGTGAALLLGFFVPPVIAMLRRRMTGDDIEQAAAPR
jgi:phosphate transport system substrate-binding protein